MADTNTVTYVSYANSGLPLGIFQYPEEIANNVIVQTGVVRYQFFPNDTYPSIANVPAISSLLDPMPIHNAIVSTLIVTPGGNSIANAAWFFQIPANTTVLADQTYLTDDIAYSNANVVVENTNLGMAGNYIALEPNAEDGVYALKFSHPAYDDFLAQVTCSGSHITIDWTA